MKTTGATPEISVVVACFEMARELPRTLLSLSPGYQRDCPPTEVIVVDNGSRHPPAKQQFDALGLDLHVAQMSNASRSPVAAINRGLALASAPLVGVWVDGARLASPGLLSAAHRAAALHPRAVVATLNYHLGPTLQYDARRTGYDQRVEDDLLASIGWPAEGYRLFEIATDDFRGDPRGPILESNALFMSSPMWDELGGYDESFTSVGGGTVNPDTLVRACALPGAQLVRIVGEGTFHQFHGGVSTGHASAAAVLKAGSREYFKLRGKRLEMIRERGWVFDSVAGNVEKEDSKPGRLSEGRVPVT
jgi:Glycosyl transferase family 2